MTNHNHFSIPAPPEKLNEYYNLYRKEIENEDTRINERNNWALLLQSAFFVSYTTLEDKKTADFICTYVIAVAGLGAAVLQLLSIWAAIRMLLYYKNQLLKSDDLSPYKAWYPQLNRPTSTIYLGLSKAFFMPVIFMGAWAILLIFNH